MQQWVHDPALLVMPAAPMSARIQREVDRLSHGWPSMRSALFPRRGEEIRNRFWRLVAGVIRGVLAYLYVWELFLQGRIVGVAHDLASVGYAVGSALFHYDEGAHNTPDFFRTNHPGDAEACVLLFAMVLSLGLIYFLYMLRVYDVDPHKGTVMAGLLTATTGYSMLRRRHLLDTQRITEQAIRNAQQRR
jgi:hypothetical protein